MSPDQMRAEFEAWVKQHYVKHGFISSMDELHTTWQAAYRAGLERAAKVCDVLSNEWFESSEREYSRDDYIARTCAAAIREELK